MTPSPAAVEPTVVHVQGDTTVVTIEAPGETRSVEVRGETEIVVVSDIGPQGAAGPRGAAGLAGLDGRDGRDGIDGDTHREWTQDSASASWWCEHGMGKRPSVTIIDSGGTTLEGSVSYPTSDVVTVEFVSPTSGKLFLN